MPETEKVWRSAWNFPPFKRDGNSVALFGKLFTFTDVIRTEKFV